MVTIEFNFSAEEIENIPVFDRKNDEYKYVKAEHLLVYMPHYYF